MKKKLEEEHVLVVREGHGANCSSIGSLIDTLFVVQVSAGVVFAAVAAALASAEAEPDSVTVAETATATATDSVTDSDSDSESGS
jgi:hypothetical protein